MDDFQLNSITLKTLRQRCEYLQQRLIAVEEENFKLKLENAQVLNSKIAREPNKLEEQIITLNKEKSEMARQMQMITNENSTLWSQLFKVLPENNISSLKSSVSTAAENPVLKLHQYGNVSNDYSKESLEEISLKLLNGIIMGKNELERQYSQMVDLQKENIEECSSFAPKAIDNRIFSKNFKDYLQKLKDFKVALMTQKSALSNAISSLKHSTTLTRQSGNHKEDISKFNDYKDVSSNITPQLGGFLNEHDSVKEGSEDSKLDLNEMICPMCEKMWDGSFDDFQKHVMNHFGD